MGRLGQSKRKSKEGTLGKDPKDWPRLGPRIRRRTNQRKNKKRTSWNQYANELEFPEWLLEKAESQVPGLRN